MHEHTNHTRAWHWAPWAWHWDSFTSPSGKFVMRWRGPLVISKLTFWQNDHRPGEDFEGCGVSWIIGHRYLDTDDEGGA